eukprot:GSChrysophyteH1.ASY1.ANO1.452.1 assembled CDS
MQVKVVLTSGDPEGAEMTHVGPLRVRLLSEWADCATLTETFGEGELAWTAKDASNETEKEVEESEAKEAGLTVQKSFSATFTITIEPKISERKELEAFNKDPTLYAVLLKEVVRREPPPGDAEEGAEPAEVPQLIPCGYVAVDCSIFIMDAKTHVHTESYIKDGLVHMYLEASADSVLVKPEVSLPLEPLILDVQSVMGYPILEGENALDMRRELYIYGAMDIGGISCLRKFYMRPHMCDGEDFNIPVNNRVCLLPGLVDLPRFKEALTSSTYDLQVYHEDLFSRTFHTKMVEDYHTILTDADSGSSPSASAVEQAVGALTKADKLLLSSIKRALEGSSHTQPHGLAPFRLEQLLSSAPDLLKEFARRRQRDENDDAVTIREDIVSEVRLRRPSKPLRWETPDDISMKTALYKVKGVKEVVKREYVQPRHERFDANGTLVNLSVELKRSLEHPKETPKIMHKPNVMEKLSETFSQARLDPAITLSDEEERLRLHLSRAPFTRMVFVFKFDDDETLLAINNAIQKVNSATLTDIQGSLRSYSFTKEELAGCVDGSLDVITGFMIIDDETRIAVLEGLAAPGCGMQSVFMDIPRQKANDGALKILGNPETLFPSRMYGEFGPDLKRIRIRNKLKKLARRPELYNRKQVELICFDAIDNLMSLRWAQDMQSTKDLSMYPPADSLNKVELLYGEAISRSDLDGTAAEAQRIQQNKEKKALLEARRKEEADVPAEDESIMIIAPESVVETAKSGRHAEQRCPPTDCWNLRFTQYLKTRPTHRVDYLSEQKRLLKDAYEQSLRRIAKRDVAAEDYLIKVLGPEGATSKIYVYASQAENFKVKAYSELRNRISKEKQGATYTFSKDFISQTVCVVDEDADRAAIKAAKESHWLTPSGFRYPKPKTLQDLITHPKRPSDSRIEELKEMWNGDFPKDVKSGGTDDVAKLYLERGYTNRIRGGNLFGKLKLPAYEEEFQMKLIGDRKKLPRGKCTQGYANDKDPNASRSVHLGGPDQAKVVAEAEEAEKKAWADKVVVDSLSFVVDGFVTRDKTLQFQRTQDILHDEPARKDLKFLRTRKSVHSDRDFSFAPPPLSIMSVGEYTGNHAAALQRTVDPTKFTLTKEGKTKDFVRFIDRNANAPRIMCVVSSHKNIPKLTAEEITGPRWSSKAVSMLPNEVERTPHQDYMARKAQAAKNKAAGKAPSG